MGKNIFVSYKYSDSKVQPLPNVIGITTARNYVDEIQRLLSFGDHIYKGENDAESMQSLKDATIGSKLGDKIFYSSITIVLISKGMKNPITPESEQWMPWEISYSVKEQSRNGGNSKTNALLAVVLPDEFGSYEYFLTENPECKSVTYHLQNVFQIIRDNMFNRKNIEDEVRYCNGVKIYEGPHSYIVPVKWEIFKYYINPCVEAALINQKNMANFNLVKLSD